MKSCQPRASIVVPQGFATGAYATSAKEKAIVCSSTAARHGAAKATSAPMAGATATPTLTVTGGYSPSTRRRCSSRSSPAMLVGDSLAT